MRFVSKISEQLIEFESRLSKSVMLTSIRRGLTSIIPVALIGSMALLIVSLPIPGYQMWLSGLFGTEWKNFFEYVRNGTFNIMALIMVVSISFSYATEKGSHAKYGVNAAIAAVVSLGSFFAMSGFGKLNYALSSMGVSGVFLAILVAVASSLLYVKLYAIRFLRFNLFSAGASTVFQSAISSILPAAVTIAVFALANHVLTELLGISDIQVFISQVMGRFFQSVHSPVLRSVLYMGIVHIFWFFGMHGSNMLESVTKSMIAGPATVSQEVMTKGFFDTFVFMGGCGAALCLVAAMLIVGKSRNHVQLAKLSVFPILFNINELVVFGLPVVLNPVFLIPFLTVPILLTMVSYSAVQLGLVPPAHAMVEWTTPVLLSGYVATGSFRGSMLQIVNLVLGTLCYLPFVKLSVSISEMHIKENLSKLYSVYQQEESKPSRTNLLSRQDEAGIIGRALAADLEHDLKRSKLEMYYQPQVDYQGCVFGMEALLRWNHGIYGHIPPPLVIALAEEAGLIDKLGYWIIERAFHDLSALQREGMGRIELALNASAMQLESDCFVNDIEQLSQKYGINLQDVMVEITEHMALAGGDMVYHRLAALREKGVRLAMDDFGMGHNSMLYLKEYEFDAIKLDGALVREIESNANCSNIISSLIYLGRSLEYSVIAEFVENDRQREALYNLGCDKYQGYLYSRALPYGTLLDFIRSQQHREPVESRGQTQSATPLM